MVAKLAILPVISMFFYMFVQLINTFFIGHTNVPALIAGVGMGNMLINVLGFAVGQGLNGALETLVAQSYGFANYHMCGVYLNRGRILMTFLMVPLIIIFSCSELILVAIKQDPEIALYARQYCTILLPGLWAMLQFDAVRKFLTAQMKNTVPLVVQLITMLLHILWCWLFMNVFGFGLKGLAIATDITYILNMVLTDGYLYFSQSCSKTYVPFDREALVGWTYYLAIGIPGACMLCFEWWAFELLAVFSGYLGVP